MGKHFRHFEMGNVKKTIVSNQLTISIIDCFAHGISHKWYINFKSEKPFTNNAKLLHDSIFLDFLLVSLIHILGTS